MTTTESPYTVPANIERVRFVVTGVDDPMPIQAAALTHRSPAPIGLRLAGGCSNMTADDKRDMLAFFTLGLREFRGLVSSGGTRQLDEAGLTDPMVTDVPAALVAQAPDQVLTISTIPRTNDMVLMDESRLALAPDQSVLPQPGVHMLIVVQSHDGSPLGWDGDVSKYFNLFDSLVTYGGWQFGMIVYNGGSVTEQEALHAASLGWPVILIRGSGRKADELAERWESGTLPNADCYGIVDNRDYLGLQRTTRALLPAA